MPDTNRVPAKDRDPDAASNVNDNEATDGGNSGGTAPAAGQNPGSGTTAPAPGGDGSATSTTTGPAGTGTRASGPSGGATYGGGTGDR